MSVYSCAGLWVIAAVGLWSPLRHYLWYLGFNDKLDLTCGHKLWAVTRRKKMDSPGRGNTARTFYYLTEHKGGFLVFACLSLSWSSLSLVGKHWQISLFHVAFRTLGNLVRYPWKHVSTPYNLSRWEKCNAVSRPAKVCFGWRIQIRWRHIKSENVLLPLHRLKWSKYIDSGILKKIIPES